MTTKPTVAVLGTGIMGGAMARNIAAAGLPVRVWNRSGQAVDAPYVQSKGRAMLSGSFEPSFTLSGALKDVDLILDAARQAGTDLALMPAVRKHFARAVDAGHGGLNMAATYLEH